MALKIRRGSEAERLTVTPQEGELIYTTDTKLVWVGDGSTVGGIQVTGSGGGGQVGMLELKDDNTPQLGGNLDLNNFSIVGVGEINIDGNIYATGNINLGDNPADTINIGGQITGSLVPVNNNAYTLGASSNRWSSAFVDDLEATGNTELNTVTLNGVLRNPDSSIFYDPNTGTLAVNNIVTGAITSDLNGSVFADDSTLLIDAVEGICYADVENTSLTNLNIQSAVIELEGVDSLDRKAGITITTDGSSDDGFNLFTIAGHNESATGNTVVYSRTRGTKETPVALQAEDEILGFAWLGADADGIPVPSSAIQAYVDSPVGSGVVPGRLALGTAGSDGQIAPAIIMNSAQQTMFTGAIMLATYADATARDAAITSPVAGMMVFNAGTAKGQIYDGTVWVDLH